MAGPQGSIWVSSYDPNRENLALVAYDPAGRRVRTSESLHPRPFAYGTTAAPAGIAVYGWDFTSNEELVQLVGYDGKLGARWSYPGNVGVAGLGAHDDGSVTLLFSIFGRATVYGRNLTEPGVLVGGLTLWDQSGSGNWEAPLRLRVGAPP